MSETGVSALSARHGGWGVCGFFQLVSWWAGIACWSERVLMNGKLRVRIPAGAAGEFSSPEFTLCTDSYSVSVPPRCYLSGTLKTPVILTKCRWQVTPKHAYILDPTKSEWAGYVAIQALCVNLSGNELIRNSSGTTLSQSSQLA